MKKKVNVLTLVVVLFVAFSCFGQAEKTGADDKPFGIVIHGGAGNITQKTMAPEEEKAYREKLTEALTAGYNILENNGTGLDAVEAAIRVMEDSPLFNAGKGAVFTAEGTNELDTSIMDGKTRNAGAAAGVKHIKNPISLARLIMERSPHVLLTGDGAEAFAKQQGIELVPRDYFYTERRWKSLQKEKERENAQKKAAKISPNNKFGTVGCVALDKAGNLAAGTSTGGMTNKRFGRVGDSPIIGAGTFADNATCAVSATGHGEYFIRWSAAYDISALMAYKNLSLKDAADLVVMKKLKDAGGSGGVIAIDKNGNIAMPFNTTGMFRAYVSKGKMIVKMYGNE